ncbi:MAG: flagellar basal-body rod protein FlgG [Candidatus Melainabacteria bacterium HGW-Melainabacteria-1]|nr:MAG: flagellar basal-body rod protein FlgG [Candidatus Melainabacteria bacterium HGW-Melainabacteria-1]
MMRALYTAASGMKAQQLNLDVTSNNLANVNTSGFKTFRAEFQDLHYQMLRQPGAQVSANVVSPEGTQIGMGSTVVGTPRFFAQGDFQLTENPLDLAIQGDGFFRITMPDGNFAYTRDGAFKVDANGTLVTKEGFAVDPSITIDPTASNVTIGSDGTVSQTVSGNTTIAGQIQLVRFVNPVGLETLGRNLYRGTLASGQEVVGIAGSDAGFGTISQGMLEQSNVRVADEMIRMIVSMRAYEANSKAIQTADEMLQIANNSKR